MPSREPAKRRLLGEFAQWWPGVGVSLGAGVRAFAALSWWSENIARVGYVFLAHQDFEPRAGPRQVFPHSSRRVTLDHCLNAGRFQLALGHFRLWAGTVPLDDDKLGVIHSRIVRPGERERASRKALRINKRPFEVQGKPHSKDVANLGAGASNQLQ